VAALACPLIFPVGYAVGLGLEERAFLGEVEAWYESSTTQPAARLSFASPARSHSGEWPALPGLLRLAVVRAGRRCRHAGVVSAGAAQCGTCTQRRSAPQPRHVARPW
jgi:hypothetical protein